MKVQGTRVDKNPRTAAASRALEMLQLMYCTSSSIASHFAFPNYNHFKPFRHTSDLIIDEILRNVASPFRNQLFCSIIIPMGIFVKMLLDRLPAIFDRR